MLERRAPLTLGQPARTAVGLRAPVTAQLQAERAVEQRAIPERVARAARLQAARWH